MVKLEYHTTDNKLFNIMYDAKKLSILGFEYEQGVDVEKLRSLQAFNFETEAHLKSMIYKMIPCQKINHEKI